MAKDDTKERNDDGVKDDIVGAPKSLKSAQAVELLEDTEEIERATLARKMKTAQSEDSAKQRQKLQEEIRIRANSFRAQYKPKTDTAGSKKSSELVWIRAMKSHHPAPKVGDFSFATVYTHYVEGMKYLCPRFVGEHLEETENALVIE